MGDSRVTRIRAWTCNNDVVFDEGVAANEFGVVWDRFLGLLGTLDSRPVCLVSNSPHDYYTHRSLVLDEYNRRNPHGRLPSWLVFCQVLQQQAV